MSSTPTVRLCELSPTLEQDWRNLYTSAFPVAEQEPETKLQNLIDTGRMLYHKTVGKQGELLCFSMVSLASDFSLLAYIATDPNQRSGGYGSKHMKALIDTLQEKYPNQVGLFLEIESTSPRLQTLSDEEKKTRQRRLDFYRRLGARRLCQRMNYLAPSRSGPGEIELDLLFFNFKNQSFDQAEKKRIVTEIFQLCYDMQTEDPLIAKVLASIPGCKQVTCTISQESSSKENCKDSAASAAPVLMPESADKQEEVPKC